jgi:hypothetical protein
MMSKSKETFLPQSSQESLSQREGGLFSQQGERETQMIEALLTYLDKEGRGRVGVLPRWAR